MTVETGATLDARSRAAYDAGRRLDHAPFPSACYAPFVSLSFDVLGRILACGANRTTVLGNVADTTIEEAWQSDSLRALRSAVAAYDLSEGCHACAAEIEGGNPAGAQSLGFDQFVEDGTDRPTRMEFALSNACNLQCVMCSGQFSSAIRAHREELPPIPVRYGDSFFEQLPPFFPTLRQARFLGGEPFLAAENFRIWDLLISHGSAPDCNVTTNGTQLGPRVRQVLDELPFSIGVSLDGVTQETVERIRAGASFAALMENVAWFRSYTERRGTSLSLTYCLMPGNIHEFADFLRFAEDLDADVYVNTVVQPPSMSLYTLPPSELRALLDDVVRRSAPGVATLTRTARTWQAQIDRLEAHLETVGLPSSDLERWTGLVERLTSTPMSPERLTSELEAVAVDRRSTLMRCSLDDRVLEGTGHLVLTATEVVGRNYADVATDIPRRLGAHGRILAARVANGVTARVVRYAGQGGVTTVATVVWGDLGPGRRWVGTWYGGAVLDTDRSDRSVAVGPPARRSA